MSTKKHLQQAHQDHGSIQGDTPVDCPSSGSACDEDRESQNDEIAGTTRKRHRTEEEKKHDRIMANRRSAKESRERRKALMENLKAAVARLTEENNALSLEHESLKREMVLLQERNIVAASQTPNLPQHMHIPQFSVTQVALDQMKAAQQQNLPGRLMAEQLPLAVNLSSGDPRVTPSVNAAVFASTGASGQMQE